jgi:hypothetical protein
LQPCTGGEKQFGDPPLGERAQDCYFRDLEEMARVTGLEPATSGVTGRHSNQLSYTRTFPCRSTLAVRRERSFRRFTSGCQARTNAFLSEKPRHLLVGFKRRNRFEKPDVLTCANAAKRLDEAPHGRLAQLVERLVYTEDVGGSSPSSPTMHS